MNMDVQARTGPRHVGAPGRFINWRPLNPIFFTFFSLGQGWYRDADKSLARPGRKQATATEDFDVHISYLLS